MRVDSEFRNQAYAIQPAGWRKRHRAALAKGGLRDHTGERERNLIRMCLVSRNAIRPSGPSSRPTPDSFQPPNGAWSSVVSLTLTATAPHSNRSANDHALSRSREYTYAASP